VSFCVNGAPVFDLADLDTSFLCTFLSYIR